MVVRCLVAWMAKVLMAVTKVSLNLAKQKWVAEGIVVLCLPSMEVKSTHACEESFAQFGKTEKFSSLFSLGFVFPCLLLIEIGNATRNGFLKSRSTLVLYSSLLHLLFC